MTTLNDAQFFGGKGSFAITREWHYIQAQTVRLDNRTMRKLYAMFLKFKDIVSICDIVLIKQTKTRTHFCIILDYSFRRNKSKELFHRLLYQLLVFLLGQRFNKFGHQGAKTVKEFSSTNTVKTWKGE